MDIIIDQIKTEIMDFLDTYICNGESKLIDEAMDMIWGSEESFGMKHAVEKMIIRNKYGDLINFRFEFDVAHSSEYKNEDIWDITIYLNNRLPSSILFKITAHHGSYAYGSSEHYEYNTKIK